MHATSAFFREKNSKTFDILDTRRHRPFYHQLSLSYQRSKQSVHFRLVYLSTGLLISQYCNYCNKCCNTLQYCNRYCTRPTGCMLSIACGIAILLELKYICIFIRQSRQQTISRIRETLVATYVTNGWLPSRKTTLSHGNT